MTGDELARAYVAKAAARRRVLEVLADQEAWSDVVREAQELVEPALKAALRLVGIDPPKWHDVGHIVVENDVAFPEKFRAAIPAVAEASRWLRRERELTFCGEVDAVPTEMHRSEEAQRAMVEAPAVLSEVEVLLAERSE